MSLRVRNLNDDKDEDCDDNYHRSILCITNAAQRHN